tara:strand:- start:740 stop:1195 length:456 start_codon:yes stop_codon:yes gene_type:complete
MKIIELKNNSFDKKVIADLLEKNTCFIAVFSKSCIHCNNMKPEWQILKKKLKKIKTRAVLLEIDYNQLDNIDYFSLKNSILGLPSIMIFKRGKKIKEYNGNRTSNDMLKFFKPYLELINNKQTHKQPHKQIHKQQDKQIHKKTQRKRIKRT